jgi:hypothetical protein
MKKTLQELARQYVIAQANINLAYVDNSLTRRGRRDVDTYNATMEQMKRIATMEEIDWAIIQAKKELEQEYDATIANIETVHNSIVEDMREKIQ